MVSSERANLHKCSIVALNFYKHNLPFHLDLVAEGQFLSSANHITMATRYFWRLLFGEMQTAPCLLMLALE